jgi:hypothetical protein
VNAGVFGSACGGRVPSACDVCAHEPGRDANPSVWPCAQWLPRRSPAAARRRRTRTPGHHAASLLASRSMTGRPPSSRHGRCR